MIDSENNRHLIFVFGTLRRGGRRPLHLAFPNARFVDSAIVNGSLYDLGEYPGIALNDPHGSVVGEVYEIDYETLEELDRFEAADKYHRAQVEARIRDRMVICWIYSGEAGELSGNPKIASGDWVKYSKDKA